MKPFCAYRKECEHLNVTEALKILKTLDCLYEKIIVNTTMGNKAISIAVFCRNIPDVVFASSVGPIQFSGGPPGDYFWILGSLRDIVIDKLMYRDAIAERRGEVLPPLIPQRKEQKLFPYMETIPTIRNLGS